MQHGATVRQHLEAAERSLGKPIALLRPEPPPAPAEYLWRWFLELNASRQRSGFGPSPIAYCEIEAWARLMAVRISPRETRAIKAIDIAYLNDYEEQPGAANG